MEELFGSFLTFLLLYKYMALFAIAFAAAFLLPLPASTTLAAAGAFASQGYFDLTSVLIVGFVANILGDTAGYVVAQQHGEKALRRAGFGRLLDSKNYRILSEYIREFPQSLIYLSRFLTQVGPAVNILAGLVSVPRKTFFFFVLIGEASYVFLYVLLGYFLGSEWENNFSFVIGAALVVISIGVIIALLQILLFKKRQHI